jgi:Na+-transporting methylmalonyl-CoA/oxaloacetate decarboxylase gamma subunit
MTWDEAMERWANSMASYVMVNWIGVAFVMACLFILAIINGYIGLALRWQEPGSN